MPSPLSPRTTVMNQVTCLSTYKQGHTSDTPSALSNFRTCNLVAVPGLKLFLTFVLHGIE